MSADSHRTRVPVVAAHPDDETFPWPQRTYRGKRTLDVAGALVGLVLGFPLMLLIALVIKLTSPGPVFYAGDRSTLGRRRFKQWKFRSMVAGSGGQAFTAPSDSRITPVGRFLRLTKLDELPQFINVLSGEMSIVGPRPEDASVVEEFYTREQLRVLSARPGLTCLVQLRVFPDFTANVPPGVDPNHYYQTTLLPARLIEDLEYVDRMSLWLDVKIISQTVYCLLIKTWLIPLRRRRANLRKQSLQ